jgi:hypothetical protein
VAKAKKALAETMAPGRLSRANLSACERQVEELQFGLAKLRKENERSECTYPRSPWVCLTCQQERDRLRILRETLASRRRSISAAKLHISSSMPSSTSSPPPPSRDSEALFNLSMAIARARSGLVQELVEVFHVVEVGGRPPIGGKAGTKGEWTIGDLILPVPGDMRRECFCTL